MILIILGKRGSGKSYLANELIKKLDNAIVLDVNGDDYTDLQIAESELDYQKYKKLRVVAYNSDIEDSFFESITKLHDRIIVIDECDRFCSPYNINDNLDSLIRYGRHKNISMILISRRPAELHRNITANTNEIICFKMIEPRDIEYLRKIDVDFANKVKNLGLYEFAKIKL